MYTVSQEGSCDPLFLWPKVQIMDDKRYWTFIDIAADLDLAYTTVRRNIDSLLKQKRITPLTRMKTNKGHYSSVMDSTQYSKFKEIMKSRPSVHEQESEATNDRGFFYLILLVPEFSDKRIKAGFTSRLDSRLNEHMMSAPTAKLIFSRPCQRSWEIFLLAYVHSHGERIRSEVFDIHDSKKLIKNLTTLFKQIEQRK